MKYHYFVSYHGMSKTGIPHVGRISINRDEPICNDEAVASVEKFIKKRHGFKSVVLFNFVRFESEEAATS